MQDCIVHSEEREERGERQEVEFPNGGEGGGVRYGEEEGGRVERDERVDLVKVMVPLSSLHSAVERISSFSLLLLTCCFCSMLIALAISSTRAIHAPIMMRDEGWSWWGFEKRQRGGGFK